MLAALAIVITVPIASSSQPNRTTAGLAWTDIAGSAAEDDLLCPYSPSDTGEFRLVAEMTIDGIAGNYASNVFVR